MTLVQSEQTVNSRLGLSAISDNDIKLRFMNEPRVDQWKRKLLDLSLRNPLLNAKDGLKFLPIKTGGPQWGATAGTEIVPYNPPSAGGDIPFQTLLDEKEIRRRLKEFSHKTLRFSDSGELARCVSQKRSLVKVITSVSWGVIDFPDTTTRSRESSNTASSI